MELELPGCRIRSWREGDQSSLAYRANDPQVWRNVRDHFPHPYTVADADAWIARVVGHEPETQFAIEVNGEVAGGVGLMLQEDVARHSAEIGYWLGQTYWGRGIMTDVVRHMTRYGFASLDLYRVYALVFEWNPASRRVLEKAGYILEGRLRKAAIKDSQLLDQFAYAVTRDDPPYCEADTGSALPGSSPR
jgi:[ribosomal protein S5]-alanine N-acetyltransferase